jgi:Rha family phage regulatory protein
MPKAPALPVLSLSPSVSLHNGRPTVTSLEVARFFGKRHDHILRDIQNTAAKCSQDFSLPNFGESSYVNEQGREMPMYHLTKDGFMMVAMGYTTPEAMRVKEAYLAAFNAMEARLAGTGPLAVRSQPIVSPYVFAGVPVRAKFLEGQAWFVARDVWAALGLAWASTGFKKYYGIRDEWISIRTHMSQKNGTMLTWISLPAVVMAVVRGRPERMERSLAFLRWIVESVVPEVKPTPEDMAAAARGMAEAMGNFARSIQA